jgi:hypothetical protein
MSGLLNALLQFNSRLSPLQALPEGPATTQPAQARAGKSYRPGHPPPIASTSKCLAQRNKSCTGNNATKKRILPITGIGRALIAGATSRLARAPRRRFHETMTLRKAKSIARHLRLTLRQVCSGDYRVNFRDGNETTAYYTDNLEDAVKTAVGMARRRELHHTELEDVIWHRRNFG